MHALHRSSFCSQSSRVTEELASQLSRLVASVIGLRKAQAASAARRFFAADHPGSGQHKGTLTTLMHAEVVRHTAGRSQSQLASSRGGTDRQRGQGGGTCSCSSSRPL